MRNWIKRHSGLLKMSIPLIIVGLSIVAMWGKWIQYESRVAVMAQELKERNADLDKAQADIVAVTTDSNKKINEIHDRFISVYKTEMIRSKKDKLELLKHQKADADKFTALLNMYIKQCNDQLMPRPEFQTNMPKGDKN